jgi:hypothetical protein
LTGIIEYDLIPARHVGSFFHLQKDRILAHPKSMAAGYEQDKIAWHESPGSELYLGVVIDIDVAQAVANEDRFHGPALCPLDGEMPVRQNPAAASIRDHSELKIEVIGCKKTRAVACRPGPHEIGEYANTVGDDFEIERGIRRS